MSSKEALSQARANYRHTVRQEQMCDDIARDLELSSLLDKGQSSVFKSIKRSKSSNISTINNLNVGDKIYSGDKICDGFF